MKDKKYNIGLIGLGKFGRRYVNTLAGFPNINLQIACRETNERPNFLLENCQFVDDWKNIDPFKLDGIIVAVNPNEHYKIICSFANIPILVEKPVCLTLKEIKHLNKITYLHRTPLLVNYIHLFSEVFQKIKELIGDKNIKSIISKGYSNGPFRTFSSLYDYAPHDLSMGLYLTDKTPKLVSYSEQKCKNGGSLWEIEIDYGKIEHKMIVGNGAERKERIFDVYLENGERLYCSDTFLLHFDNKNTLINSYHFEHDMSLGYTIKSFLHLIDGETDDRAGMDLTIKITKILEQIANDVI